MSKQIFKKDVPRSLLFILLEQISLKTDKYYVIDINAFRKFLFHELDKPFIQTMLTYYHLSKQFYVTRKMTYNSFINVVRHICKNTNIMYTSQIRYNESEYNINYHIYYEIPSLAKERVRSSGDLSSITNDVFVSESTKSILGNESRKRFESQSDSVRFTPKSEKK
jgi:hypothetical protein